MEQLSIQYVDQRRSFTKIVTTVKKTTLRYAKAPNENRNLKNPLGVTP